MKAKYPNSLGQDEYSMVLNDEYQQTYPEFSIEQIEVYVNEMVGVITRQINEIDLYKEQIFQINTLQSLKSLSKVTDPFPTTKLLFIYLGKKNADLMEDVVRHNLEDRGIAFPEEHKDQYLKFVSEVTAKVIDDICDTTKAKLIVSRLPKDRLVGSKSSRTKEKSLSFVKRVGRRSRSSIEEKASFGEKEQRKRARVHFADGSLPPKKR